MSDSGSGANRDQSQQRVARMLTLIKLLTEVKRPQTRAMIFAQMSEEYPDDSEATKRKFERDKKAVRELLPIQTSGDEGDEDTGYRIQRDAVLESRLVLTAEEAAIVSLAIEQSYAGPEALRLISSAAGLVPRNQHAGHARDYLNLSPLSHNLQVFMRSCSTRRRVSFQYRKPSDSEGRLRHMEVWGLIAHNGHWYVGGLDIDAEDIRVFRADRVLSAVDDAGPAVHAVDPRFNIAEEVIREHAHDTDAVVAVKVGSCQMLRQRARTSAAGAGGWDELTLDCRDLDATAGLIARFGAKALVKSPEELRLRVLDRLRSAVGADHV